jgi:hypothetical protein
MVAFTTFVVTVTMLLLAGVIDLVVRHGATRQEMQADRPGSRGLAATPAASPAASSHRANVTMRW